MESRSDADSDSVSENNLELELEDSVGATSGGIKINAGDVSCDSILSLYVFPLDVSR